MTIQQETFTSNVGNYLEGFLSLFSINKQSFLVSKLDKEIKNMCNSEISSYKIIGVATFFAAFGMFWDKLEVYNDLGLFVARKLLTFGDILSVSTISVSVFNGVSNLSSKIIQIKGVFPNFEKQLTFSIFGQGRTFGRKSEDFKYYLYFTAGTDECQFNI
ncbi:hypothetical protein ABVA02_09920 [Streptococcus dysgalactiae subsp. equisimilis]